MSVTADLTISSGYVNTTSTGSGGSDVDTFQDDTSISFTDGTADNKVDRSWSHANAALAGTETLTLSALVGPRGSTVAMVKVRTFYIRNLSTTVSITVAPGATHGWALLLPATGITIGPGGIYCVCKPIGTGYAVVAGTTDQIDIAPVSGTGSYKLEIAGTSA